MDPWKEALACYNDLADEVVRSGEDWPYEFTWDYIGKVFNESYEKATGDWVISCLLYTSPSPRDP